MPESPPPSVMAPAAQDTGERAVRWGNVAVWGLVAVVVAIGGVMLIPLTTSGGARVPIAPGIALVANAWLPRVMWRGAGWKLATYVPAVVWAVVALASAAPTSGGDLLIPGNSYSSVVGVIYLGLGAMSAVIGIAFSRTDLSRLTGRRP